MEAQNDVWTQTRLRVTAYELRKGDVVDIVAKQAKSQFTILKVIRHESVGLWALVKIGNTRNTKKHLFHSAYKHWVTRDVMETETPAPMVGSPDADVMRLEPTVQGLAEDG